MCSNFGAGAGCSLCARGYFQAGSSCAKCPTDPTMQYAVVGILGVVMLCVLWRVTKVKNNKAAAQELTEGAMDLQEAEAEVAEVTDDVRTLSNQAIYAGIGLNSLQLSVLTFELPIGFPPELEAFARFLKSLICFDMAQLTSPECQISDDKSVAYALLYKFVLTHGLFFGICAFLMVLCKHGEHHSAHTTNSILALYTLSIGTLVGGCVSTMKCSYQPKPDIYTLDMAPDVFTLSNMSL